MKKIWAALILIVVVFISYAPAVRNGFVWDDTALILRDPLIRSWRLIPEGFNHFLFVDATASDFYRPIQRLNYAIDYAAFAFRPGPYLFSFFGMAFFLLRQNRADLWKMVAVAAFVAASYYSLRARAEHNPAPRLTPPPPLLVRPIIVARAVAEYAGLILFPMNLHMDRDVETQPSGFNEASMAHAAWRELQTLVGLVLIAIFFYWMLRARKRNPAVFTALLFGLIAYLPVSGIVALNATAAEHWIYLPSAFFFLAIALEIVELGQKLKSRRSTIATTTLVLGVVWMAFLGARTFARTFDWKDQRTFLERTIAHGGDSARMLINLGGLELTEGKLKNAAVHLHAALQKKPDQPLAIINLAAVALKQKDFKLARELLTRATQMPPVDAEAHQLLAVLESKESGKVDLMRMRLAARTGPPNWSIEKRYIQLLDQAGGTAAAINELLTCLQPQWYRAESWKLLSDLHAKLGHSTQAAEALEQARAYDVHLSTSKLEN